MDNIIDKVYTRAFATWTEHGNSISVQLNGNVFLLNISVAIVWKMLDGERTGSEIIDQLYVIYSEYNNKEYLNELYTEAIKSMLQKEIIKEIVIQGGVHAKL